MYHAIWISLGPIVVINAIFLVSLFSFLYLRKKNNLQPPEYLTSRTNTRVLSLTLKHWWYWQMEPVAKLFARLGFTPNAITGVGFLISILAAYFYAMGWFGYAGWTLVFGATFDMFDGIVARVTNQMSQSGAFFDSVMDRFSEAVLFLGLAFYFRNSWVLVFVFAGLIGSMMVSYTRARGEGVGVVATMGSMQRPERVVYLGVSGILEPVATYVTNFFINAPAPCLVIGAVCFVGVMTNATACRRISFIMKELDRGGSKKVSD